MVERMIPLLAIASAPKWLKWGGIALVLIAIVGAGLYVRHQIYQEGFRAAQEACERERRAQEAANNAVIKRETDRLMREAEELARTRTEFEDALKQLDEASNADPDGASCGLSDRARLRLNEIVGYGPNPAP